MKLGITVPLFAALVGANSVLAQSTAFTYQGELTTAGTPATGAYDMQFAVYDVATGGTDIGFNCVESVPVANGKFTVPLDYAALISSAAPRYLELRVRADTSLTCPDPTGYTTLSPRQLITPAPLAIHANTSQTANVALNSFTSSLAAAANSLQPQDGSPINAVYVDSVGRVGIGTTTPGHSVTIATTQPTLALQDTDSSGASGGQQVGYVSYRDSLNVERAWVGYGSIGDPDFSIVNVRPTGDIVLNPTAGNVGVGTATPAARLDVRGDIKLGPSGQYFATKSTTNDRIVRGRVGGGGVINAGSGFTVTHTAGTGVYIINFSTPFAVTPVTTVASANNSRIVSVFNQGTTFASIEVALNGSGTAVEGGFSFIAIGSD